MERLVYVVRLRPWWLSASSSSLSTTTTSHHRPPLISSPLSFPFSQTKQHPCTTAHTVSVNAVRIFVHLRLGPARDAPPKSAWARRGNGYGHDADVLEDLHNELHEPFPAKWSRRRHESGRCGLLCLAFSGVEHGFSRLERTAPPSPPKQLDGQSKRKPARERPQPSAQCRRCLPT